VYVIDMKPAVRHGALGLALAGLCGSLAGIAGAAAPLEGTAWVLDSLGGNQAPAAAPLTARFADGRVQGTDGCNRYSAAYVADGKAIQVEPRGIATQMACAPGVMQRAADFMAALSAARSYRIDTGRLRLFGADGHALAQFNAQPWSLVGTSWVVVAINNGRGALASILPDISVTMDFTTDETASGSAGCNTYSASYRSNGDALRFGATAATCRMCAAPEVMVQEQAFFKALESVAVRRIEANRLELRRADGALALDLTRVLTPEDATTPPATSGSSSP